MRIVNAGEINALATAIERLAFIQQQAKTKTLQSSREGERIMIAEHGICVAPNALPQLGHRTQRRLTRTIGRTAIVARHHTQVVAEAWYQTQYRIECGRTGVCMEIAEV